MVLHAKQDLINRLPADVRSVGKAVLRSYGTVTADQRPLPDFLIVGTKRGGTTSLWNYLLQHPLVLPMFPARQRIKSNAWFFENSAKSLPWYRSHFPTRSARRRVAARTGHVPVAGEASPYYMYDPRIADRVRAVMPDVKVIMQLRDPTARAYSHYQERVNAGVEDLDFEHALAAEPDRLRGERARMREDPRYYSRLHDWFSYRDRGIYFPQVEQWSHAFPTQQIHVMRSEDLYADAQAAFDEITAFLGLPPHPMQLAPRHNYRPAERMPSHVEKELREFYRPHNLALYEFLGRDMRWEQPPA